VRGVPGNGEDRPSQDRIREAGLALSSGAGKYTDYFETCRRKRNVIDYTRSDVATDTEADEIVDMANEFAEFVEAWIDARFPHLKL
jgi:hypothetical protein